MMIKLDACPFCGGRARLSAFTDSKGELNAYVICSSCGAQGHIYESIEKASECWNARVYPEELKNFLVSEETKPF